MPIHHANSKLDTSACQPWPTAYRAATRDVPPPTGLLQWQVLGADRARATLGPLEPGHGQTLGAALRHALLSCVEGCAATEVTLNGDAPMSPDCQPVPPGLLNLLLNLKGVLFSMPVRHEATLLLQSRGPGTVTAGEMLAPHDVMLLNPAHVLASHGLEGGLELQIKVRKGSGHQAGNLRRHDGQTLLPSERIVLDSSFSPVVNFSYRIHPVGVGTGLEHLTLELQTNGAVSPAQALRAGLLLLQQPLDPFSPANPASVPQSRNSSGVAGGGRGWVHDPKIAPVLLRPVDDLELPVRARNGLRAAHIQRIGDLVVQSETALLRAPYLGRKSLLEIKQALALHGLMLGMQLPWWPPEPGCSAH